MAETPEPRALTTALAGPAFATRGAGLAMHAANRHVDRWAPEASSSQGRPMRSLGFVDRLIGPWIETAQRSAGLRLFGQYNRSGFGERAINQVSWVFPRPWYQDELDWMTAARQTPASAPALFTTRGTYVAPAQPKQAPPPVLASALYEFVAPSLSVAAPMAIPAFGQGESARQDAYSSLIPLAAVQAAELMTRAVTPTLATGGATARMTPALRAVLSSMLERASSSEPAAARVASRAPELVTPPAPRPAATMASPTTSPTLQLAERYAEQRAQLVEVHRLARQAAERAAEQAQAATAVREAAGIEARAAAQRAEVELRQRVAATRTEQLTAEQRAVAARTEAARMEAAELTAAQRAARTAQAATARTEAEQRAATARAEAEQRAARTEQLTAEQRRQVEVHRTAQQEQARLAEQRIAQRVAERTTQRLHEQARAEAAAHARTPVASSTTADAVVEPQASGRVPAEVIAALAAFPPELASVLGQHPERAIEALGELNESLRVVELMARSAASGSSAELTRGPRLMMPAGIGGLVAAVDRASSLGAAPDALLSQRMAGAGVPRPTRRDPLQAQRAALAVDALFAHQIPGAPADSPAVRDATAMRAPSASWLAPRVPSSSALRATIDNAPAALTHIAWADRWLARFAGASQHSLDTLAAGAGSAPSRMQALAAAAPHGVFVAPIFDTAGSLEPSRRDTAHVQISSSFGHAITIPAQPSAPFHAPSAFAPSPSTSSTSSTPSPFAPSGSPPAIVRYDDNAETPDDVFAAISAAAAHARIATATASEPRATTAMVGAPTVEPFERPSIADAVAHGAPSAPNAGFAAQLASSPFAVALRHILAVPNAPSFDVRALFGGGMSATYLAGLLAPESRAIELATAGSPSWATWIDDGAFVDRGEVAGARAVPGWDPTYVTPETAGLMEDRSATGQAAERAADRAAAWATAPGQLAPLTTLRSAVLSWNLETDAMGVSTFAPPSIASSQAVATRQATGELGPPAVSGAVARGMIDAMSLPMLGEAEAIQPASGAWAAPGMVGNRAHGWSVAQERSVSDLALDFVTPELVLAARVYGLGPAEAAQAFRLALAGPGQLTAMASTVDRTFVQAMAIEADRRERIVEHRDAVREGRATRLTTAYPTSTGELVAIGAAAATEAATTGAPGTGTTFGVERRPPRGAYLWPAATVGALGLTAAAPDGDQSMSVAALELLAAHAVAEIGTFAALGAFDGPARFEREEREAGDEREGDVATARSGTTAGRPRVGATAGTTVRDPLAEPGEADVLGAAAALVPSSRRARFDALYIALGQSSAGASWSPAARAARALALAGRGDDAAPSARERATVAWDVLPVVYATERMDAEAALAEHRATGLAGAQAGALRGAFSGARGVAGRPSLGRETNPEYLIGGHTLEADHRPGLGGLSARAGEALGSYVTSTAAVSTGPAAATTSAGTPGPAREREIGAVLRPPTAAQELVRTGRPSGRHGGGETEIPPWFEAAARRMFERDASSSSDISLAELTLVTAAPSTHIAASGRTAPTTTPTAPSTGPGKTTPGAEPKIDVAQLADDIYRYIITNIMDVARARNGEPYL